MLWVLHLGSVQLLSPKTESTELTMKGIEGPRATKHGIWKMKPGMQEGVAG